ncbi:MAG: AzlD domain-containing protein [Hyphomicrobiales bacterium]
MNFSVWQGEWSYILLFIAGFCVTQPWRYMGVVLSKDVSIDSEVLVWVNLVSTALVAGLVARLLLFPAGAVAEVPLALRMLAFLGGMGLFMVLRQSMAAGVLGGIGILVAGIVLIGI